MPGLSFLRSWPSHRKARTGVTIPDSSSAVQVRLCRRQTKQHRARRGLSPPTVLVGKKGRNAARHVPGLSFLPSRPSRREAWTGAAYGFSQHSGQTGPQNRETNLDSSPAVQVRLCRRQTKQHSARRGLSQPTVLRNTVGKPDRNAARRVPGLSFLPSRPSRREAWTGAAYGFGRQAGPQRSEAKPGQQKAPGGGFEPP